MELGKIGLWFFLDAMPAPQSAEFAQKVENSATAPSGFPRRSAANRFPCRVSADEDSGLNIATGIANIYGRDPITMSAASKTVAELSGGRFLLGIGVSHKPLVSNLRGHSYDKPYSYMKEIFPK